MGCWLTVRVWLLGVCCSLAYRMLLLLPAHQSHSSFKSIDTAYVQEGLLPITTVLPSLGHTDGAIITPHPVSLTTNNLLLVRPSVPPAPTCTRTRRVCTIVTNPLLHLFIGVRTQATIETHHVFLGVVSRGALL